MSPAGPSIEDLMDDPRFQRLDVGRQRQLLGGMEPRFADFSDEQLGNLLQARANARGMSGGQVMSPVSKFLTAAGQGFQQLWPPTSQIGQGMLHMIGGPDPTTGETTGEWASQLPIVSDINRLRQGQVAEELGGLLPQAGLSLLGAGFRYAPELSRAGGATLAGLKGAGESLAEVKTGVPAVLAGGALRELGVPHGFEIGAGLVGIPRMIGGFRQGMREFLNPPGAEPLPSAVGSAPLGSTGVPVTPPQSPTVQPSAIGAAPIGSTGELAHAIPAATGAAPKAAQTGTTGWPSGVNYEYGSGTPLGVGIPEPGVKVTPETGEATDFDEEMRGFHAAVQRLEGMNQFAKGGPTFSAKKAHAPGYTGGMINALNIDPANPAAPRQIRALRRAAYQAGRLLTTDEAQAAIKNIK